MYNYSKLLGAMREKGLVQDELANRINVNAATLNKKLKNNSQFKQNEIVDICHQLSLPLSNINAYFFCIDTCEKASILGVDKH